MSDFQRPTIREIAEAAAREFEVSVSSLPSFERSGTQAKIAVAMIGREYGYHYEQIGNQLQRRPGTVSEMATEARALIRTDAEFRAKVLMVRSVLLANRKRKPVSIETEHLRKLEQHRELILKLRHCRGKDGGWSLDGLSRYTGIPKHIIAPVIGVYQAER